MPKMKTHSGAKKRFKRTANGGYKYRCANRNHILSKKSTKRKRHLRGMHNVNENDVASVRRMLREI